MPKRPRSQMQNPEGDDEDWNQMHPGLSSGGSIEPKKSRKELRKEQRLAKKQRRAPAQRPPKTKLQKQNISQPAPVHQREISRVARRKPKKSILATGKNSEFYKQLKQQNLITSQSFKAASQKQKEQFLEGDDSDPEDAEIERLERLLGVSGGKTKEAARDFPGDQEEGNKSDNDNDGPSAPKRRRTKAWKQMELELRKDGYGHGLSDLMMDLDRIGSGHLRKAEGDSARQYSSEDESQSDESEGGGEATSSSGSSSDSSGTSSPSDGSDSSDSESTSDSDSDSGSESDSSSDSAGPSSGGPSGRSSLAALIRERAGVDAGAADDDESDAGSDGSSGSDEEEEDDDDGSGGEDEAARFRRAAARRKRMAAAMYGGGASSGESGGEEGGRDSGPEAPAASATGSVAAPRPGAYVPPHLRRAAAASSSSASSGPAAAASAPAAASQPAVDPRVATMKRRIKGLVNRLAETNVDPISKELHGLRGAYASAEVTAATAQCVVDQLCSGTKVGEQLIVVYAALLATQHVYAGAGAGSTLLEVVIARLRRAMQLPDTEELAEKESMAEIGSGSDGLKSGTVAAFGARSGEEDEDEDEDEDEEGGLTTNEQQNLSMLLGYMFLMGMVQAQLVVDVLRLLASRLRGADVRVVLLLLKLVGSQLRSDDAEGVRGLLQLVKRRAAELGYVVGKGKVAGASAAARATGGERARVQVVLELLGGLRRAKQRQDQADSEERGSRLRKWLFKLRRSVQADDGSVGDRQIRIRWDDIVNIPRRGRWWITGASWAGRPGVDGRQAADGDGQSKSSEAPAASGGSVAHGSKGTVVSTSSAAPSPEDSALLEAAASMRMNTDLRRRVFVAVMGSRGVQDAMERVGALGLRGPQEREVVRVLLDCCGQEEKYNPYYAAVGARLCEDNQSFRFTFQLSLWDQFKLFGEAPPRRIYNLARLSAALVQRFVLGLSFLKVFDFLRPTKTTLLFLRTCLGSILEDTPEAEQKALWKRIGSGADRGSTRDGLILFLQGKFGKFVSVMHPGSGAEAEAMRERVRQRIRLAVRVLESQAGTEEAEEATAMLEARNFSSGEGGRSGGRGGGHRAGGGGGRGRPRR